MNGLPSLAVLRAFDAVARLNSVSASASESAVTPSAVSRQIGNFEEVAGVALPTRDGRGVRLTSDGRPLEWRLADALARIDAAVVRLQGPAHACGLRVIVPPMFASAWPVLGLDRAVAGPRLTADSLLDAARRGGHQKPVVAGFWCPLLRKIGASLGRGGRPSW
ncbi:MAG: LysR family transcriptional regulator [Rhodospirillales bacterium]|nr:LysR family transcriptional regulator [Rhodospirillales bacterium]MDE0379693.1 LysR family transcriptional regulator [Rhodospirillales bacterium]